MIKIALVTPVLPVPFDQSRGQFILETATSLSRIADVRVYLLQAQYAGFFKPSTFFDGIVPEDYKIEGIDLETINYPVVPILSRGINPFVSSQRLTPRVRDFGPDIVLGYWIYPDGYAAQLSAEKLGLPNIMGALGSDIHERSGMTAWFSRRAIQRADATITVSQKMTQTTISDFGADPNKVTTVTNGYNQDIFFPRDQAAMRTKLELPADGKIMLYVGRLVDAKGLRELVDAFEILYRQDNSHYLVLGGDGVLRPELEQTIKARKLGDVIRLAGSIQPEQVCQYLGASNLLTLPSWTEGWPNVLVEALACARPVVTTAVGGIPEFVNERNGVFVEVQNAESLANGLKAALNTTWDDQYLRNSIQRSWDDVASETLQVIQQTLARRKQAV